MEQIVAGRPFAVVTGASSGIGYELAKVFAEEGYVSFLKIQVNTHQTRLFIAMNAIVRNCFL